MCLCMSGCQVCVSVFVYKEGFRVHDGRNVKGIRKVGKDIWPLAVLLFATGCLGPVRPLMSKST